VILWHAGLALAIVWNVFRDAALDHRLIVAGALLPDAVDLISGHPAYAHTLLAPVTTLVAVMALTRGRRAARRRLLALPIGMFLHLVLDGVWTNSQLLWWPFFGTAFPDGRLLSPLPVTLAKELVGAWALGWFVWHFRLWEPQGRVEFLHTGRLLPGRGSPPRSTETR
jgi:membrane-bound metal-dependent hydrolase YbcI (DUF457 family)